jgi:hypothetical protein
VCCRGRANSLQWLVLGGLLWHLWQKTAAATMTRKRTRCTCYAAYAFQRTQYHTGKYLRLMSTLAETVLPTDEYRRRELYHTRHTLRILSERRVMRGRMKNVLDCSRVCCPTECSLLSATISELCSLIRYATCTVRASQAPRSQCGPVKRGESRGIAGGEERQLGCQVVCCAGAFSDDMSVVRDLRIVRVRHIISALAGGLVGLLFDTGWIVEHL